MRQAFLLSLLASACCTTLAQSNVTVYGILDVGVASVSGLRNGTAKQVVSGAMDGSRLGFSGSEDMGGGYRAIFTLESRLFLDTGGISTRSPSGSQLPDRFVQAARLGLPAAFQPVVTAISDGIGSSVGVNLTGNFWDRQTFVGLVTPVGAFMAGRQYTPAYEVVATFDTLLTQSSLSAGQVASFPPAFDIRVPNALAYRMQLGGLTASAMFALSENSTTSGRLYAANVIYRASSFSVGLGHNARENERGDKSLRNTVLGATLDLGPGRISAMVADIKDDNPSGLSGIAASITPQVGATNAALIQSAFVNAFKQDSRVAHIGYRLILGPNTVYVAYTQLNDKRPINADTRSYGGAYSYALSKRTDISAVATRIDNSGTGQVAPGGAGYIGGVTASAGTDSTSLALVVRHRF